jgi:hypothetical protein
MPKQSIINPFLVFWILFLIAYAIFLYFFLIRKVLRRQRPDFHEEEPRRFDVERGKLLRWQREYNRGIRGLRDRMLRLGREAQGIKARIAALEIEGSLIGPKIELANIVLVRKTRALIGELEALKARPPPGFLGYDFVEPLLILYFEDAPKGLLRKKEALAVRIDLETGLIEGPIKAWNPENKIAALKLLSQGRVTALVRMIGNTLIREERKK